MKTTRNEFLLAVGTINAEFVTAGQRGGLVVKTTYPMVADRVASIAKSCGLRILQTIAENDDKPWIPIYVVGLKGFGK